MTDDLRFTVLGSASPCPRAGNPCSGYLVEGGGARLWMDAGSGALGALREHIRLDRLDGIWISHLPVEELAERIDELPQDAEIVVYCRGEYCVLAYDAVRLLTDLGRRAARLNDGMLEWRLPELPVDAADLA